MKHVRFLRLLMMTCLTILATGAWAQKTYNSFAELKADNPEGEVILNFKDVQVLYVDFAPYGTEVDSYYHSFLKDESGAIQLVNERKLFDTGQLLNGSVNVIYHDDSYWQEGEDDNLYWGEYIELVNYDESSLVFGNTEIVPLEVSLSEITEDLSWQLVTVSGDWVLIGDDAFENNHAHNSWLTDGESFVNFQTGVFLGDPMVSVYDDVVPYLDEENYKEDFAGYTGFRKKMQVTAIVHRSYDEDESGNPFYPVELHTTKYTVVHEKYVPVVFKKKFEGFTSFYWDVYAGKDYSLWGSPDMYYSFDIPEDIKVKTYRVENGKGYLEDAPDGFQYICHLNPIILELKDKSFANGDVTVDLIPRPDHWSNGYRFTETENMLYGYNTTEETNVDGDTENYKFYRLTLNANQDKGSIGFYWGAEDGGPFTTSPHKVFLAVPRDEAYAAAMPFDGTTGLAGVKTVQSENNDIYSLSGVKVNGDKLPKGVYITNGKKVVIK